MSEIQDEDIITLTDENGNDVEFLLLDVVEYNNDDYMVMIPLDDEEIEDDELTSLIFAERYGKEDFDRIWEFLSTHEIDDLHDGNVGFDDRGEPVLIDFSGYHPHRFIEYKLKGAYI